MAETNTEQAEEAATIKAAHPGRCRVMTDVGRFKHVITVQPMNMDATIKFQLPAEYPKAAPVITVRSEALSDDAKIELQKDLLEQAENNLNKIMVQILVDRATLWLKENGVKPGKSGRPQEAKASPPQRGKKHKKKKEEEEVVQEKLVSMKTADDVIKRIMWDGTLQSDDFLVGYWDRFRGIVEKYFSAFSWEDIASVDYTVLAIPKHRIQYFKYKTEVVWDKGSRLDNVFGSTGSGLTITNVIERYEKRKQEEAAAEPEHDEDKDQNEEDDSDSDSDDGITVTIGNTAYKPSTADHYVAGAKTEEWDKDDAVSPFWTDKLRPNYFMAVRVTDKEVLENLESVQDYILENEPRYASCCIPCASLHVTLCTLGLDTPEQVNNAVEALKNMREDLADAVPKDPLKINGVKNFYNRVVYAQVNYPESFLAFVDVLKMNLKAAGIEIRDGYEYVPHMTIMKTTRPVSRQMGTKNVSPFLYEGFADMSFGSQSIDGVYLCSMQSERREDGFYISPSHIDFAEK